MKISKLWISVLLVGALASWAETAIACGSLAGEKVAIQPQPYRTFAEWCLNRDRLSPGASATVGVLLAHAGTSDCYQASKELSSFSQLLLDHPKATDLSPLQALPKLTNLRIGFSQLTDLSPLQGMTQLTRLELSEVPVEDIQPLQGLVNLTDLKLTGTLVTDLGALRSLKNLTSLEVGASRLRCPYLSRPAKIKDVSPLSSLSKLTTLNLDNNSIENLVTLSSLTQLTDLDLRHNKIRDLAPLKPLVNLSILKLSGNPIWDKTCPVQPASVCQFNY